MNDKYLISQDFIKEIEKATGQKYDKQRRTGRTTMLALQTIARAMYKPERDHVISDHYGTTGADKNMAFMIERIISQLYLKGFEINYKRMTLTFHLFEPKPLSSKKGSR